MKDLTNMQINDLVKVRIGVRINFEIITMWTLLISNKYWYLMPISILLIIN